MKKETKKFSAKEVKMATGIAKQKHDSMTDAVERIEKIAKGLSNHHSVARALRVYNEETKMKRIDHEEFGIGEVLETTEEGSVVLFDHGIETVVLESNKNDESDDGEGMDPVQPKEVKKKFKNRKDKDIDNDGDEDESDEYLHNRRKAISKDVKKESSCSDTDAAVLKKDKKDRKMQLVGSKNAYGAKKESAEQIDEAAIDYKTVAEVEEELNDVYSAQMQSYIDAMKKMWEATSPKQSHDQAPKMDFDNIRKSKGEMDFKNKHRNNTDVNDYDEKGHEDATKAGRATKQASARPGDNRNGDKTPVK